MTGRLDPESGAWLAKLRTEGPAREAAIGRLHALLLREARHEVRRRTAGLAHPSGRDLDDLALQAADDALVAILGKLDQFRGEALFTTWARRFAALEVPGKIRRRLGHTREVPTDSDDWPPDRGGYEDPQQCSEASELARTFGRLIAHELTAHQREVLLALTIDEVAAKELAARLDCTPGALYKTLHDARCKLKQQLAHERADHELVPTGPSSGQPPLRPPLRPRSPACSGDGPHHQRSGSDGTSTIDPAASLGELVAERPARAPLFERLQLDYFCGGRQTLAEVCNHRGLEIDTVRTALDALDALDAASVEREGSESKDWRRVSVAELCAHIVAVHHDGLRKALARIEALLSIVVRVHGWAQLDLRDLQKAFVGLRGELEPQLASEQSVLFPACLALERRGTAIEETLLEEHERECVSVGDGLAALRVLGGDYDPQHAVCSTHRALLDALAAFELDLHQHIHEENNVLLPRVRELNARTPSHPV